MVWVSRLKRCVRDAIELQTAVPLEMIAHSLLQAGAADKPMSPQEYAASHDLERQLGLAIETAGLKPSDKVEVPDACDRLHSAILALADANRDRARPRATGGDARLEREVAQAVATAQREGAADSVLRVGQLLVLAAGGQPSASASPPPAPAPAPPPPAPAAATAAATGPATAPTPAPVATKLPLSDVELGGEIAEGQFATVCRGLLYGQKVAVKQLKEADGKTEAELERELEWEVGIMSTLLHPSLVALLGVSDGKRLVLEFREGTLYDAMQGNLGGDAADAAAVRAMFADVLSGLAYLHTRARPVVHRDLKPPNVLCDGRRRCKLADFGTAQPLAAADARLSECIGTALYMAPEVEREPCSYGLAADVFSFGVMLYECYYYLEHGEDFYNGDFALFNGLEVVRTPLGEDPPRVPDRPASCADDEWEFLRKTLAPDEHERPRFVEAAQAWSKLSDVHSGGKLAKWLRTG